MSLQMRSTAVNDLDMDSDKITNTVVTRSHADHVTLGKSLTSTDAGKPT